MMFAISRRGMKPAAVIPFALLVLLVAAWPAAVTRAAPPAAERPLPADRTLLGHEDGVLALQFFPDNKRLASGGHDNTVRLWDADTGKLLHTFNGHAGPVHSVSVSRDSKWIASGSMDQTARVWDVATGKLIAQLRGHTGSVSVAFLPNGNLVTAGGDGTVRIWDVKQEKALWRSDVAGSAISLSVTPDGKLAAYGSLDGVTYVLDLATRRRIGHFGTATGYPTFTVHLTSDGKRVYAFSLHTIKAYDLPSGKEAQLPENLARGSYFALSADDKFLVDAGAVLEEVAGGTSLLALDNRGGGVQCEAFSPDGRRLALGTGGSGFDVNNSWVPSRENLIEIYTIPAKVTAPAAVGPVAGSVSWEIVPFKVRDAGGAIVPFERSRWNAFLGPWTARRPWRIIPATYKPAGKAPVAFDVICNGCELLIHREKGVLDEIVHDPPQGHLSDVAWDGQHIWLASVTDGIRIFGPDGKQTGSIGAAEGLPPSRWRVLLHALEPGRVLAAGFDDPHKGGGWCAILKTDPAGGGHGTAEVFFTDANYKDPWTGKFLNGEVDGPWFRPLSFTEPPAPSGKRVVWLICDAVPRSPSPVLQIDTQTLACTSVNLTPEKYKDVRPEKHFATGLGVGERLWLNDHQVLVASPEAFLLTMNEGYFDQVDRKLVVARVERGMFQGILNVNGQHYWPGREWYRIDPGTGAARHVGPGVRNARGISLADTAEYFVSTQLGLAAFSPTESVFYRISLDPAHPLEHRATLDPVEEPAPAPPEPGVVDALPQSITFRSGTGDLEFLNGRLASTSFRYGTHRGVQLVERAKGITVHDAETVLFRVRQPGQAEQFTVTSDQLQRARAVELFRGKPPERAPLEQLFRAYTDAGGDAAKAAAAQPLFAAARAQGDQWAKETDEWLTQVKAIFTPQQWRLAHYEDPNEPAAPASPSGAVTKPVTAAPAPRK